MKLNCELVKELYVLYEENELSENIKNHVEEHLKECSKCNIAYTSGNFSSNEFNDCSEDIPTKIDEKILLTLKLNKLKRLIYSIILAILLALLLVYFNNRKNLTKDLNYFSTSISNLSSWVGYEPNDPISSSNYITTINYIVNNVNREYSMVYRNLNLFEKNQIKEDYNGTMSNDVNSITVINSDVVTIMSMLKEKLSLNAFTSKDEELSIHLNNLLFNVESAVRKSANKSSKNLFADTTDLRLALNELNNFATAYVKYNKSYEQLSFLPKRKLEEKLQNVFNNNIQNINVEDTHSPFNYNFEITLLSKIKLVGTIDSVLGRITSLKSTSNENYSKEVTLSPMESEKWIKDIMLKNLDNEFDINIEYLGENISTANHTDKEPHYYNFNIQPKFKGYNIFSDIKVIVNGYTGELDILSNSLGYKDIFHMLTPSKDLEIDIKYTKEEALNNLIAKDSSKTKYTYKYTRFIPSLLTNKNELVYCYIDESNTDKPLLFINTCTGKEEFIYSF